MTTTLVKRSKTWHVLLWVAQAILASMFLMVGFMKVATPMEELSNIVPLAKDMPVLIRIIGLSEVLGGLGLLLPAALRIKPRLTIFAAVGLAVVMLLAMIYHLSRGEVSAIGTNIILGILAVFIAWGRSSKAAIAEKGFGG